MNTETMFLSSLHTFDVGYYHGRLVREHERPLIWVNGPKAVFIPTGFQADGGSVPRLPVIYAMWGARAHRECHLHDYGYRRGARVYRLHPDTTLCQLAECHTLEEFVQYVDGFEFSDKSDWDYYFRAAMKGNGWPRRIYQPMYWAVRSCGGSSYQCYDIMSRIPLDMEIKDKLDDLIEAQEAVTEGIEELPASLKGKEELVEGSEKAVEELKDAKEKVE